jgi:uncharacterized RDD family membrane protein YckC
MTMKKLDELYRSGKRPIFAINANGQQEVVREETFQIYEPLLTVNGATRFFYWLADMVAFILLWWIVSFVGYLIYYKIAGEISGNHSWLFFFFTVFYCIYYIFFESVFQQTPGKMLAGVKVVDEYGQRPKFTFIIARTLLRLVPFEKWSCLGEYSRGWHDSESKTYVLKISVLNERLRELEDDASANYNSLIVDELNSR